MRLGRAEVRRADEVLIRGFFQYEIPEIDRLNRRWTETEFEQAGSADGRRQNRIRYPD